METDFLSAGAHELAEEGFVATRTAAGVAAGCRQHWRHWPGPVRVALLCAAGLAAAGPLWAGRPRTRAGSAALRGGAELAAASGPFVGLDESSDRIALGVDSAPADDHPTTSNRTAAEYKLVKVDLRTYPEARCLDGSPGALYIANARSSSNQKDWILYLEGGGWCMTQADCVQRAFSDFGSSRQYPATQPLDYINGIMSMNCSVNPEFCNYSHVIVKYCDAASYSGDRAAPLEYDCASFWGSFPNITCHNGTKLHFKGKKLLEAVVETLLEKFALDEADRVLLTGCSAGGLGAILNADRLREQVLAKAPHLRQFAAVPLSGFFLEHDNLQDGGVYPSGMLTLFNMANVSVDPGCARRQGHRRRWKCLFAEHVYDFIKTPTFLVNSALDAWQLQNILTSQYLMGPMPVPVPLEGWKRCYSDARHCDSEQIRDMNHYITDFRRVLTVNGVRRCTRLGNGAFINACMWHCEGQNDGPWQDFRVHGVSLRQAVSDWWRGEPHARPSRRPPLEHTHIDTCYYTGDGVCNPTCTPMGFP